MNYSHIKTAVATSFAIAIYVLSGFADNAEGQLPPGITVLPNYQSLVGPAQPVTQYPPTQTPVVTIPNVTMPATPTPSAPSVSQPPTTPAPAPS
jgi:hypothetical protein